MHGVRDGLFFVGLDRNAELNRLGVSFFVVGGVRGDLPVVPAIEVFDDTDFHGFFLTITNFYLEGFIHPFVAAVGLEVGGLALANEVKGISRADADGFVTRR